MKKNQWGIVTFFLNKNYGSVLQCYALQKVLKRYDIEPVALNESASGRLWILRKTLRLVSLTIGIILHPCRLGLAFKSRKESIRSVATMPVRSVDEIERFINQEIKHITVEYDTLKKEAKTDKYTGFISGSDQVWNPTNYFLNPFMYLQFAPQEKRFSYAASFGVDSCPPWFKTKLKKYLSGYCALSIREKRGLDIVESFSLRGKVHLDPTLLLTRTEWEKIAKEPLNDSYAFAFFLNEPSELAANHIRTILRKDKNVPLLCAPYVFKSFETLANDVKVVSLSPEEFLGTIMRAKYVFTDSFHGLVFSMIFRRVFYVYERQYGHDMSQNSRIKDLLERYCLKSQYVTSCMNDNTPNYGVYDKKMSKDRDESLSYIKWVIACVSPEMSNSCGD